MASRLLLLDFNTISPLFSEEELGLIRDERSTTICISPAADYWAERNSITYRTVDKYVDSAYLKNKGHENFGIADKICKELTAILLECEGFKDLFSGEDIDAGHGFYYTTKIICDAIYIRHDILSKILDEHKGAEVYYFASGINGDYGLEEIVFRNRFSAYYKVLKALADERAFKLNAIEVNNGSNVKPRRPNPVFKARKIIKESFKMLLNMPYLLGPGVKGVLLLSQPYDWEEPLKLLVKSRAAKVYYMTADSNVPMIYRGLRFYVSKLFPKILYRKSDRTLREGLDVNSPEWDHLRQRLLERRDRIPLDDTLFKLLLPFLTEALIKTRRIYTAYFHKTKEMIKRKNIRAIVSIMVHHPVNFMRVRAAQELGIPLCVIQHGGVGYDVAPMYYWGDVYPSDYVFLYGNALKEYYQNIDAKKYTRYYVTGSSRIDSMRSRKRSRPYEAIKKKKCLYLLNILHGNTSYINRKNYKSDIYLWRKQKNVLDIFSRYKDWCFIIKPHPDPDALYNPLINYIAERGFDNVIVDYSNVSADIMKNCELVILDYLGTSFIEAMALHKDTVAFSGYYTIKKDLERRLKETVSLSADEDEFLDLIDASLKRGPSGNSSFQYDSFLADYVTHLNDNKSAERIKDRLMELMASERPS